MRFRATLLFVLLIFAAPAGAAPNIIVFMADDLGWADVGVHGSDIDTPHIDGIFRDGLELERFYASPICSPTRAAVLTGRSPIRFGLQFATVQPWSRAGLPAAEVTLAERLAREGYQTALVGKWHLGHAHRASHPNPQGFENFYGHLLGASYYEHKIRGGHDFQRNGVSVHEDGYSTALLGAEMVRFIEERDPTRPFFLFASFFAPHVPLEAPTHLVDKYRRRRGDLERGPDEDVYAAMVDSMDGAIGKVLGALTEEGIAERTVVVFLSDNGAARSAGSNQPFRGFKKDTYEGGIHVPAAILWPGEIPAGRTSQLMRDTDLFPTLLAAAVPNAPPNNALDGANLLATLRGGDVVPRKPFFFGVDVGDQTYLAAIDGPWKLVSRVKGRRHTDHLFQLDEDPNEVHNLAGEYPETVSRLRNALFYWVGLRPGKASKRREIKRPRGWRAPDDWSTLAPADESSARTYPVTPTISASRSAWSSIVPKRFSRTQTRFRK